LNKVKTELAETQLSIAELKQIKSLQINYQNFLEAKEKLRVYDSIYKVYKAFSRMAKRKFEEGESNYLEKITAESKASQIEIDRDQLQQDLANSKLAIQALLQVEEPLILKGRELKKLELKSVLKQNENLSISALTIDQKMAEQATKLAKHQLLPGISASYFIRSNSAIEQNFNGYQVGLNIPLLFFGDRSKIKSARLKARAKEAELTDAKIALKKAQEQLIELLKVQSNTLTNYENHQLKMATEILNTAKLSYKAGEIDFFRYVQSIEQAQRIKLDYLSKLREYNQTIIQLNYFLLN
jgi:cobalt-zinc-cadmium resistance protein CzcA